MNITIHIYELNVSYINTMKMTVFGCGEGDEKMSEVARKILIRDGITEVIKGGE